MDEYFRYMYNGKEADERMMNSRYEEGKEEGMEAGLEKGKVEGEKNKQMEIAKSMLDDDIPIETISKYTNLTIDEIIELQNK